MYRCSTHRSGSTRPSSTNSTSTNSSSSGKRSPQRGHKRICREPKISGRLYCRACPYDRSSGCLLTLQVASGDHFSGNHFGDSAVHAAEVGCNRSTSRRRRGRAASMHCTGHASHDDTPGAWGVEQPGPRTARNNCPGTGASSSHIASQGVVPSASMPSAHRTPSPSLQ